MILLSENTHEDEILSGITALLIDLGIDADSYRREDALAPVFWSANDLELEGEALSYMSKEDRIAFLQSIEDAICACARKAGCRTIRSAVRQTQGGHAHLNARTLRI